MNIQIKYVKDAGILSKERIILKTLRDDNIGDYIIADTTYKSGGEVSNKLRHMFWIPDKKVKKDDLIVIYTKTGNDKSVQNESGNQTHFFYWGLEETIWNKNEDNAIIFHIDQWDIKKSI